MRTALRNEHAFVTLQRDRLARAKCRRGSFFRPRTVTSAGHFFKKRKNTFNGKFKKQKKMDNRFYNSSRSVLTGALKTTRQLNKRQKDILGFIYRQAECMHASVYREHGCIAISSVSLGQACRPAVSDKIALSIAYELENAGFIKIVRANKGEKGVANRYMLTDLFFEWMKVTNDEFKKDENMDRDNESKRQIQSLQERVDELTHQLEEARKANDTGNAYEEVPDEWRAQAVEIRQNDGRTVTRTKGEQFDIEMGKAGKHPVMRLVDAFGIFNQMRKDAAELVRSNKALRQEIEELKRENAELKKAGPNAADQNLVRENKALVQKVAKLEEVAKDKHNKFMASNSENFAYRNKIGGLQDEIRELKAEMAELEKKYKAADQELEELKGADGMVTVEPGEPYKVMKVDEFMQELSSIKKKN